jgi:hypothetical protein
VGAGKAADLTYWEGAARMIASVSKSSKIVVEKSTVPVKTAEAIEKVRHMLIMVVAIAVEVCDMLIILLARAVEGLCHMLIMFLAIAVRRCVVCWSSSCYCC